MKSENNYPKESGVKEGILLICLDGQREMATILKFYQIQALL